MFEMPWLSNVLLAIIILELGLVYFNVKKE